MSEASELIADVCQQVITKPLVIIKYHFIQNPHQKNFSLVSAAEYHVNTKVHEHVIYLSTFNTHHKPADLMNMLKFRDCVTVSYKISLAAEI